MTRGKSRTNLSAGNPPLNVGRSCKEASSPSDARSPRSRNRTGRLSGVYQPSSPEGGPSRVRRLALLPKELLEVEVPARGLVRDCARLPSAERLHAHDRTRRGPANAVRVGDARLDAVEERLDLLRVLAEDPRREPVLHAVRDLEGLLQASARNHAEEWDEELLLVDPVPGREAVHDRGLDEVPRLERPV